MTFRELLKKHSFDLKTVSKELDIPYTTLGRYDNLMLRKVKEVIDIHNYTKIPYNELLATTEESLFNELDKFTHTSITEPDTNDTYLKIIASQQRTIEELSKQLAQKQ